MQWEGAESGATRRGGHGGFDMSRDRARFRPSVEGLEERLDLANVAPLSLPASPITPGPPGVGTDSGTLAVLEAFSKSYGSSVGQSNYVYGFDLNHNGQIGQADAKLLLRALPPVSANTGLTLNVTLSPQDKVLHPHVTNLGGVTYSRDPLILGHTLPGALIFTGTGTLDWKLRGPVLVADANGNFSFRFQQSDGINPLDLQAIDRYGHQVSLSYPVLWLGFGAYENAHPKKT
jgi:hypothetical protein